MPPFGFRKRARSPSPPSKNGKTPPAKRAKPTLFETADTPRKGQKTLEENKKYLEDLDDDDDDSSLSESESEEFEDVPPAKRLKTTTLSGGRAEDEDDDDDDQDDDDEMEWEDAIQPGPSTLAGASKSNAGPEITDISISMKDDGTDTYIEPVVNLATGKKAPSRLERQLRYDIHCVHVQTLMWHNTFRNSWLNDAEVQKVLVDGLPDGVRREVQKWKDAMGTANITQSVSKSQSDSKGKSKQAQKGKGKKKSSGRDWNEAAATSELDLRGGDPLPRLLKVLTAYWRKRFTVTAPGLRKQGYKDKAKLNADIRAWKKDRNNFEEYGERIENIAAFSKIAKKCEGSRDVGAQLFVALLRGLGLETRMVANLQPAGFGWSKAEEADLKKTAKKADKVAEVDSESEDEEPVKVGKRTRRNSKPAPKKTAKKSKKDVEIDTESEDERPAKRARRNSKAAPREAKQPSKPSRKSARGNKSDPIDLDESDSPLSDAPFEPEDPGVDNDDDDDISIVDITPPTPKKKPIKKYDRDLAYPIYWTEVCSPVSHKYYPVDPIVLSTIASNDELLQTFEPRGKKAEKSKQVMCYTVAFSSDGTAKDVTVRYLKRHQLPGKTKGVRMAVAKIPIHNWKGKVKGYQEYDWFGTLMLRHARPHHKRTLADDLEEQTDLKPFQASKEQKVVAKESLAGYKQSAEFVLEQHLRREEALVPDAEPVKYFTSGKGDKAQELPVYLRADVAVCKTVESWHKEGRVVKVGEQPLKYVPVRAVTLTRKREVEDAQRETGEKMKQGLYSEAQTEWIIPPPVQNGVIPKNAFGNMDVYVPTMVPKGAIHLPLKGSAKLCRKLEIDYAEACTGFEFGNKRAVPILTGVVVAEENAGMVRDAWRAEQKEVKRKADTKRTATSLHWWRKMLLGLRVLERMRTEYADNGGNEEDVNPFIRKAQASGSTGRREQVDLTTDDDNEAGGFLRSGDDDGDVSMLDHEDEDTDQGHGGGFLVEDDNDIDMEGGGFLIEDSGDIDDHKSKKNHAPITPVSLQSLHKTLNGATDSEIDSMDTSDNSRKQRPVKRTSAAANARKGKTAAKGKGKAAFKGKGSRNASATVDLDSTSLSDLSEPDVSESAEETQSEDKYESDDSEDAVERPGTKKAKPPNVVVNVNRSRGRSAKKVTPVRSRYFEHSDDDDDDLNAGSEDESDVEVEVVKPRKTTARTRART